MLKHLKLNLSLVTYIKPVSRAGYAFAASNLENAKNTRWKCYKILLKTGEEVDWMQTFWSSWIARFKKCNWSLGNKLMQIRSSYTKMLEKISNPRHLGVPQITDHTHISQYRFSLKTLITALSAHTNNIHTSGLSVHANNVRKLAKHSMLSKHKTQLFISRWSAS